MRNEFKKINVDFDELNWKFTEMKDIPQQENTYDCGVYICKYALELSRQDTIDCGTIQSFKFKKVQYWINFF